MIGGCIKGFVSHSFTLHISTLSRLLLCGILTRTLAFTGLCFYRGCFGPQRAQLAKLPALSRDRPRDQSSERMWLPCSGLPPPLASISRLPQGAGRGWRESTDLSDVVVFLAVSAPLGVCGKTPHAFPVLLSRLRSTPLAGWTVAFLVEEHGRPFVEDATLVLHSNRKKYGPGRVGPSPTNSGADRERADHEVMLHRRWCLALFGAVVTSCEGQCWVLDAQDRRPREQRSNWPAYQFGSALRI